MGGFEFAGFIKECNLFPPDNGMFRVSFSDALLECILEPL
jgi:hypothetical protein